jgi:hypothetical protein
VSLPSTPARPRSQNCCEILRDVNVDVQPPRLLPRLWASLSEDGEEDEDELALLTPLAAKSLSVAAQLAHPSVEHEAEGSKGWQEVLSRGSQGHPSSPAPTLPPCSIPAWLFGRC